MIKAAVRNTLNLPTKWMHHEHEWKKSKHKRAIYQTVALTEAAHSVVLDVDVESGVARVSQHVTPRVVGVVIGAAQFDIRRLVVLL